MEADRISALVANENRRENSEKAYLMKTYPVYRDKFIRCFTEIDNWTYYGKQRHLKHKDKYLFTNFKSVNPNHHDCLTCCLFTKYTSLDEYPIVSTLIYS